MRRFSIPAAAVALALCGASAQASTIFSQDFSGPMGANEAVGGNFLFVNGTVGHSGVYNDNEYSYYDLSLDLTGVTNTQLSFDYTYVVEDHYDRFNLLASTGGFLPPASLLLPVSGMTYTHEGDIHREELGEYALAHDAGGTALFDLSAFDGQHVKLRFQFGSDFSVVDQGANLDNLLVTGTTVAGGVPEPATWAMMIVGFGVVGATVRGSRRRQAISMTA